VAGVLVTGGAGYVGIPTVCELLTAGHRVRVLDSLAHGGQSLLAVWAAPSFDFVRGDIRDPDVVRRAVSGMDSVVHLAAVVGDPACARNPELARAVNLDGSRSLLVASREAGVRRFVFVSTCSNYGRMADPRLLVTEETELRPISLYAETKVHIEREVLEGQDKTPFCATILRLATVYGVSPRMRFDLTVNEFTMEMATRKHLVVFGEQFWRPYVHVRDVARAVRIVVEAAAKRVRSQVFNVGDTGENYQKAELVRRIRLQVPDAVVEFVKKDEDPRDYRVSFAKIARLLGYKVTRSVDDGIAEVVSLVRSGIIQHYDDQNFRN